MRLNEGQVEELLPQKFPFKFVDTVEEMDLENKTSISTQVFKDSDFYFKGHFPKEPIVPGVLIVESSAQAALILISNINKIPIEIGYLVNIKKATFHTTVKPNEKIFLKCSVKQKIGKFYVINAVVTNKLEKIAKLELTLST